MNKKISTLMSGLLLTSAFASARINVTDLKPVTFENGKVVDGKYFIDSVTHTRSGGKYTISIEAHLTVTDF